VEEPRNASVENGLTEPEKIIPGDRKVEGNPSPGVEDGTRRRSPGDGEVVEPVVDDNVARGSSPKYFEKPNSV
jgi:hypothetical protein